MVRTEPELTFNFKSAVLLLALKLKQSPSPYEVAEAAGPMMLRKVKPSGDMHLIRNTVKTSASVLGTFVV